MLILLFVSFSVDPVAADPGESFTYMTINPGDHYTVNFTLAKGDCIYARCRIIYGVGIYFFIVDQAGQNDISSGHAPHAVYNETTFLANSSQWGYVSFRAPYNSTWYVWFSKATGVPLADTPVTIEGYVRKDTDGPSVEDFSFPLYDHPTGVFEFHYSVIDQGHPIQAVKLQVNGTPVDTDTSPAQTNSSAGFEANGTLSWSTWSYASGLYNVTLVAYDSLGHSTTLRGLYVQIANPYWSLAPYIVFLILLAIVGIWYVWNSRRQRRRLMDGKIKPVTV